MISILILTTPKIIAEESENLTCFKEIISKSEAVIGTGWAFVISSSDDNELQLENFLQHYNYQTQRIMKVDISTISNIKVSLIN